MKRTLILNIALSTWAVIGAGAERALAQPGSFDVALPDESAATGGPAEALGDIETDLGGPRVTSGYGYVQWNGVTYFGAHDRAHGYELWRSDGTDAGTQLLADILPGPDGSLPRELTVMGDRLYFTAFDGVHGFGLWSTDGTSAGTRLVKGAEGDFLRPGQLTAYGALLLLTAGPRTAPALWRTDGTTTEKVLDLGVSGETPGFAQPRLAGVVSAGYAWLMSRTNGRRVLWRTDGSAGMTAPVWTDAGIPPQGPPHGSADIYAAAPGGLLYRGHDGLRDGLWFTDGSGATLLLQAGSSTALLAADWFTPLGAWTYFLTTPPSYSGYSQVWRTNGTPAGTSLVTDFGSISTISQLTASAGRLFVVVDNSMVVANDGSGGIWNVVANGWWPQLGATPSGAVIVAQGQVALSNGLPAGTVQLSSLAVPNGYQSLVSSADVQQATLALQPALTCFSSSCWFRSERTGDSLPPSRVRRDPVWHTSLTPASTGVLASASGRTRGSSPEQFVDGPGGDVYFATNDALDGSYLGNGQVRLARTGAAVTILETWPSEGCNLFWSDGTACIVEDLTALPNHLVFFRREIWLWRLWTSNGIAGEATPLDAYGAPDLPQRGTGVIDGKLVFVGQDGGLWTTDGTKDGTRPLGGPANATAGSDNLLFTPVSHPSGDWLYFSSLTGLWRTDGTPGSVELVAAVPAAELAAVDGRLFFSRGGALWKTEVPSQVAQLVKSTNYASRLTAIGQLVFFTAYDPASGTELWMSNGKTGGTKLVADIRPGPQPSNPDGLVAVDDVLYFSADDGVHGRELWRWDPVAGVALVADIVPGPQGSLGEGPILVAGGTRAWFPAWTPQAGVELWSSDGTSTAMVQDIAPGAAGSHPRALTAIGGRLYFSADDGVHGQEPWSLPVP